MPTDKLYTGLMAEVRDTKGIVVETKIVENSVVVAIATYK